MTRSSIRTKLLVCIGLLLTVIGTLAYSAFSGVYAYRGIAKSVATRASELPLASEMAHHVSNLEVTLGNTKGVREIRALTGETPVDTQSLREQFRTSVQLLRETLERYRDQLEQNQRASSDINDFTRELEIVGQIKSSLKRIDQVIADNDWLLDQINVGTLNEELRQLHTMTAELPTHLQERMNSLAHEVRGKYRGWIVLSWLSSAFGLAMLVLMFWLSYAWVLRPLRVLIQGSRIVAGGQFGHRIQLDTHDEIGELAAAMNAMTARFQQIKGDLDWQVRERTMEVVRSEQLASVGVLAAGVAHEINNPLASIAFRAEALEERLHDVIAADTSKNDTEQEEELQVVRSYLSTIQDEAFRCKGITDRLLDFSREGTHERRRTNLGELIDGVIDMVRHLGKYREKEIVLDCPRPVIAEVDAQEMKQVVLNLVTNGLEAVKKGGTLTIRVSEQVGEAEVLVIDDGCGMTPEILAHIFEPFFTSRHDGQGNGLGLAITHRIIKDHGGRIVATSDGPGRGSQFRVTLPTRQHEKDQQRSYQAA